MKTKILLATAGLAVLSLPALSQSMKPGLWEISNKMQGAGGGQVDQAMAQAQKEMANMPPDQRKMVEEMMAKRGVKMGAGGPGGGMSVRVCMTREMVEKNEVPTQRGDCKNTQQSRSGNTMKMAFVCTNPPSSGEGQITFVSNEAYNMQMAVSTQVQGKPEKVNMESSGKWLGGDCGDIKPMAAPRK